MKKIILIVFSLMILFSSCCREEVEITPSITYKVGIVQDINVHQRTLALEFQSSFETIEKINFESIWTFEINGSPIYLELHENDFEWSRSKNGNSYKGICKTSLGELLATPNVIHKRTTLKGKAKINGKWIKI
jgi:lipoprotein